MQVKLFFFVIQFVICFNKYSFINAKPLIGEFIRPIEDDEFHSVACILQVDSGNELTANVLCTGTLISTQLVITAEQCFYNFGDHGFVVNIGLNNITASTSYAPMWWVSYDNWANILGIPRGNTINDIGIIKAHISILAANLPTMPLSPPFDLSGKLVETVGCGTDINGIIPQIKQTVPLFVLTNPECEVRTALIRGEFIPVPDYWMCTISYPFALLGNGDIGGPLLADDGILGINIGLGPMFNNMFHPDKVNLHIKIEGYRNFITSLINM